MKELQIGKIYLNHQSEYVVITGRSHNKQYSMEMVWFRFLERPECEWNAPYHGAAIYWFPLAYDYIA